MNADRLVYTEHNIECWVEMMIDRLDMKYELCRISSEEYSTQMEEIKRQADRFYALGEQAKEPYVYEL